MRISTFVSCLCGAALVAALPGSAQAQFNPSVIGPAVNQWMFNEPDDTPLTGAGDSVGTSAWTYDLGYNPGQNIQSSTIQNGAFQIQRPGAGYYINSFAPVDSAGVASGKLYLVGEVTWDYLNSTSGADFRMGFHHTVAPENTTSPTASPPVTILAEIVVRRFVPGTSPPDQPVIGAWGSDENGNIIVSAADNTISGTAYTPIGSTVQPDPVLLVLELDTFNRWGAVHWSMDSGATYTTLGGLGHTFDVNATWDPNYVRLGALNNFVSGDGTGLRLYDLAVAVPEPATLALLALGSLPLLRRRRR